MVKCSVTLKSSQVYASQIWNSKAFCNRSLVSHYFDRLFLRSHQYKMSEAINKSVQVHKVHCCTVFVSTIKILITMTLPIKSKLESIGGPSSSYYSWFIGQRPNYWWGKGMRSVKIVNLNDIFYIVYYGVSSWWYVYTWISDLYRAENITLTHGNRAKNSIMWTLYWNSILWAQSTEFELWCMCIVQRRPPSKLYRIGFQVFPGL